MTNMNETALQSQKPAVSKNNLSIAGEFAVLSQLALRGFDANLTLGNTKGVDILVSDPVTDKMLRVEVKTAPHREVSERHLGSGKFIFWVLGKRNEEVSDPSLYYAFVTIDTQNQLRYFIVPSSTVAETIKRDHEYWLEQSGSQSTANMRKFKLRIDEQSQYGSELPHYQDYENAWELLRQ